MPYCKRCNKYVSLSDKSHYCPKKNKIFDSFFLGAILSEILGELFDGDFFS